MLQKKHKDGLKFIFAGVALFVTSRAFAEIHCDSHAIVTFFASCAATSKGVRRMFAEGSGARNKDNDNDADDPSPQKPAPAPPGGYYRDDDFDGEQILKNIRSRKYTNIPQREPEPIEL